MENEWQYWTGNHETIKDGVVYLGIYKDKSGSISFLKNDGTFWEDKNYLIELNPLWMDDCIGYYIEQDIQE